MPSGNLAIGFAAGGVDISKSVLRTGDGAIGHDPTLPVGFTGTLSTRSDDNTGTVTLTGGHGIATSDVVDIYWSGGVQYAVTVGTVSVNSMPFDSGVGDNLPAQDTAVVVTKQVTVNVSIDGDALKVLAICLESTESTGKGHIDMLSSAPATIEEIDLVANVPQVWDIEGGAGNVFTGNPIVTIKASNGSATAAATLKIAGLQDTTP